MKAKMSILSALLLGLTVSAGLQAQGVVDTVKEGCAPEIEQFCSGVTLGEGRLLACFYAYEDKLSGQCQYALYQAANQLDQAISALNYVAGECENDIVQHCAEVQMGEGRIVDCLKSKADVVSAACTTAINEVFE